MNWVVNFLFSLPRPRTGSRRRSALLHTIVWIALVTLILALPLPSAGLPAPTAAAPHALGLATHPDVDRVVAPGAPATTSAQAIAAAQASLASAWGGAPTITSSGCASAPQSCSLHLNANPLHLSGPVPNSKRPQYPPPTTGASVAYDPAPATGDSYVAMFGGLQPNGAPTGQTWIYESGYWENITQNASTKRAQPLPRWDAMMAYDGNPQDQFIVLFGGCLGREIEGLCGQSFNDTWELSNGVWFRLMPRAPPPSRWDGAITYDPALSSVGPLRRGERARGHATAAGDLHDAHARARLGHLGVLVRLRGSHLDHDRLRRDEPAGGIRRPTGVPIRPTTPRSSSAGARSTGSTISAPSRTRSRRPTRGAPTRPPGRSAAWDRGRPSRALPRPTGPTPTWPRKGAGRSSSRAGRTPPAACSATCGYSPTRSWAGRSSPSASRPGAR